MRYWCSNIFGILCVCIYACVSLGLPWGGSEIADNYFAVNPLNDIIDELPTTSPANLPNEEAEQEKKECVNVDEVRSVFDELNSFGMDGLSARLKHVEDSWKVKFDRDTGEYKVPACPPKKCSPKKQPSNSTKPRGVTSSDAKSGFSKECINTWEVSNLSNGKREVVEGLTLRQCVYVKDSSDSSVVVKDKVNTVVIDSCVSMTVEVYSCLSMVELINSTDITLTIRRVVPSVTVDKCSGIRIDIIDVEGKNVEVYSSLSTDMNITFPDDNDPDNPIEMPIPEQFVSKINEVLSHIYIHTVCFLYNLFVYLI
eukprot:GHVR01019311.1.p1 GENE.GHVR01019311.1~~GHVR01019311.1.p1  ORF type:complete len:312 (+),score=49.56 GHVR01019311.1:522-1457(+)